MSSIKAPVLVRDSLESDVAGIQAIYAHHVLHGTASFELTPPTLDEMRQRRADVVAKNLPYLVAEQNGQVVGYAYVTLYRPRPAYRFTVEDSVYVREGLAGQGIGSLLLSEIIKICTAKGYRQLMAVVGDASPPSVSLHQRHGFTLAGTFKSVGYKFGAWRDTAMLQRPLGDGDSTDPAV
jgi:L-amino acid N-acyltransferase YncA